jgi:4-hydroxy-2-oxoheptanedioate aldolase
MPRINKCIELLEQGQPVFATGAQELSYDAGRKMALTSADMIEVEFEHHPFDTVGLREFMRGLRDGGPTPSGHLTPTVVCTLPSNCISPEEVRYNAWQSRHVLTTGVHGILHTHARSAEAVRWFVATCRYPFQTLGRDQGIPEGLRGAGGQVQAAAVWGIEAHDYVKRADPWPMNPAGELLLGLKIEDRHPLMDSDAIAAVPGIAFAEWGPGDMAMSHGDSNPEGHDPPFPPHMDAARNTVKASLDRAGVAFLCSWGDKSMTEEENLVHLIENIGSKIMHMPSAEVASAIRQRYGRTMPV